MRGINFSITSIQKYVKSMQSPWNYVYAQMAKTKPFLLLLSGLGTRLVHIKVFDKK